MERGVEERGWRVGRGRGEIGERGATPGFSQTRRKSPSWTSRHGGAPGRTEEHGHSREPHSRAGRKAGGQFEGTRSGG